MAVIFRISRRSLKSRGILSRRSASNGGARREARATALDSRLHLANCATPLQASLAPGGRSATRVTVQVRCADPGGWRVYVPVELTLLRSRGGCRPVRRPRRDARRRGPRVEERETSSLPASYMRDPAELAGFTLARPVVAGTVISPSVLSADHVIHRGDVVTLIAQSGAITVRAQGRAHERRRVTCHGPRAEPRIGPAGRGRRDRCGCGGSRISLTRI